MKKAFTSAKEFAEDPAAPVVIGAFGVSALIIIVGGVKLMNLSGRGLPIAGIASGHDPLYELLLLPAWSARGYLGTRCSEPPRRQGGHRGQSLRAEYESGRPVRAVK